MTDQRRFPREPGSVSAARHFVATLLGNAPAEAVERVEVMVSELATNAILHAGTDFEVCVALDDETIRIEITDTGAGDPEVQRPRPRDQHGRGLRIVEVLADDWGVVPARDGQEGKTVWFTIALDRGGPA